MILLGLILLVLGVVGFGLAAYWDLKTTEFPDWLPYVMIIIALALRGVFAFIYADAWIFLWSLLIGSAFLGFGLLMYYCRQWGDGDAWLLGVMGFLFPNATGFAVVTVFPFPLTLIFNFFFISFFYLLVYSIALGMKNPKMTAVFFRTLRGELKGMLMVIVIFSALCAGLGLFVVFTYNIPSTFFLYLVMFPILLVAIMLFARYGKFVEKELFKRQIDAKKIREGDVPIDGRWRSLSEAEVRSIRARGGKIWIKEGVRFAPAFLITLLFTMLYGGIFALFILF